MTVASYPLAPVQEGMLFHHLMEPGSGVDIEQMVLTLREPLDANAFARAWSLCADRFDVLRTAFRWTGTGRPLADVAPAVEVGLQSEDWRALGPEEREPRLRAFLHADRLRGFELETAPLFRLTVFRIEEAAYQLVWTFHHAILDGRSFVLVLEDAFACYKALLRGDAPARPQSRSFGDYVAWLEGLDASGAESYWRERLRGFTAPTPLPHAEPPEGGRGAVDRQRDCEVRLSAATTARLRESAREHGCTLSTVVQGAWAILLARHSGESDVVFGATRANRRDTFKDAGSVAGLFINTLPLRAHVAPELTVAEFLCRLREQWIELDAWGHTPLSRVRAWSDLAGDAPLFESIVVFEHRSLEATLRTLGGAWERRDVRLYERNNFPITLAAYGDERLLLRLEYDGARFDDVSLLRVLGHLETILSDLAQDWGRPISALRWLRDDERRRIVVDWNATGRPYPPELTLHGLVEAQVRRTPAAIAVEDENSALTYGELDDRAGRLALHLQSLGVIAGELVGICAERSVELIVGLLGILKAGAAYVPLDSEYPPDRLAFMLEDSAVRVLLVDSAAARLLPASSAVVVRLDAGCGEPTASLRTCARGAAPDDPAYMIYTSGSTGRPKGALNGHRAICNRLLWMQERFELVAADAVLQKTPLSFDISVWEIFWPLSAGARLVMARSGGHREPQYLAAAIERCGITVLHFVPSMLRQFLLDPGVRRCVSVRHLVCSGEALAPDLVDSFFASFASAQLHNLYGPTEAAVEVTHWTCRRDFAGALVPIGRPVANTQIYILDAEGRPVAAGVAGELHIGGVQVGLGYHRRPELTAEKFIPDPFSAVLGARLYRTGDLARFRQDGTIEYLGRLDDQIKLRGFRIEPGEIEAALLSYAGIRQAVVVARDDSAGSRRLIAYFVADAVPRPSELRAFLAQRMPAHMVPAQYVALEAFPLSPSGKVDRRRLPDPAEGTAEGARRSAPRTALEATLANIWAAILRVPAVAIEDNFFELGGDSLLTMQLASRIRDTFGLEMSVRALFATPTIAELARALVQLERKPGQVERIAQIVQRVEAMSADELEMAARVRAG